MSSVTRMVGLFLLLVGVVMAGWFFLAFDVSVETAGGLRVVNLDLMSTRQNGIIFGFGIAVLGAFMVVIGKPAERVTQDREIAGLRPAQKLNWQNDFDRPKESRQTPTGRSAADIERGIDWSKI